MVAITPGIDIEAIKGYNLDARRVADKISRGLNRLVPYCYTNEDLIRMQEE